MLSNLTIPQKTGILIGAGAATLIGIYLWKKKRSTFPKENQFVESAKVEKIIIYPVKSLAGVEVQTAEITKYGLKCSNIRDRQWIMTKGEGDNNFITQRHYPTLALISVSINEDEVHLNAKDMPPLILKCQNQPEPGQTTKICKVYGQYVNTLDCGDEAAKWIQKFVNLDDVRFAQFLMKFEPRKMLRNITNYPDPGAITYQDDSAVNILSVESVTDLNSRLELQDKVSYKNFRPSLLIDECPAYKEDDMIYITVGTTKLVYMEPCTRCVFTTVNPETGVKNLYEPLRTLRKYRMSNDDVNKKRFGTSVESLHAKKSPRFAVYHGVVKEGRVCVGDSVYAFFRNFHD